MTYFYRREYPGWKEVLIYKNNNSIGFFSKSSSGFFLCTFECVVDFYFIKEYISDIATLRDIDESFYKLIVKNIDCVESIKDYKKDRFYISKDNWDKFIKDNIIIVI